MTLTGETAVYFIPVGLELAGGGDFSSISKGMTLQLTVETAEDGTESVVAASILSR